MSSPKLTNNPATLLRVEYQKSPAAIELEKELPKGFKPKLFFGFIEIQLNEGDATGAIAAAPVKVEQIYQTSTENHHPMEPHASIAVWEGKKLKLYHSVQSLKSSQATVASLLGLKPEQVQIISKYVGGMIFSIGQALMEETGFDKRWANPVTRTLADYHLPAQMDVPEIDVHSINKSNLDISVKLIS